MDIKDDILDLIRDLPANVNDTSTTTEFKFLTVGSVLWACHDEIIRLRAELEVLRNDRRKKGKKMHGVQTQVRNS